MSIRLYSNTTIEGTLERCRIARSALIQQYMYSIAKLCTDDAYIQTVVCLNGNITLIGGRTVR
jgi:hypothetical protein